MARGICALAALENSLTYSTTRFIHFAYGAGYAAGRCVVRTRWPAGGNLCVAIPCAGNGTTILGAFPSLRSSLPGSLLLALLLSGCSPFYLLRAAYEEGKILWRREPIEELVTKTGLDAKTREKLETVLAVREYARDALRLRVQGSYAAYSYVDRQVLSHMLMAVPKTDLTPYTWWFLFVGRVPYKGFFSQEAVRKEADRFRQEGYDTYIRAAAAFSTLGWFDDPLLAHLLEYDKVTLAEIIFHELLHSTLFVSGSMGLNESLANFVGHRAAIVFFRDRYGTSSPEYRQARESWQEGLEFARFITQVTRSLRDLYERDLPEEEKLRLRGEVFSRSQKEWAEKTRDKPAHRYRSYSNQGVNNAVIVHHLLYLAKLDLFESLYQANGTNLARFIDSIRESIQDDEAPLKRFDGP
jgi:predicted aminopeptidase